MAVWVIRAGGQEEFNLENGICAIGFDQSQSIADFDGRDALTEHLRNDAQSWGSVPQSASQMWRFAHEIEISDMVVMPRSRLRVMAVGRVKGDYAYKPAGCPSPLPHTREVEWRALDVPRDNFDTDLLNSLGGIATVFQPRAPNSEARIERVMNIYLDEEPDTDPISTISGDELPNDYDYVPVPGEQVIDEQVIKERIKERIRQKYHGHDLEYLIEEILKAEGYFTLRTTPGPDGGADILAGKGELGFENRLCVQVKSGASTIRIADYNRLQGNVHGFGADYGLLVSLSGFTKPVLDENRRSFFQIRLWDGNALVEKLLDTYDDLPQEIRATIPLAKRLVLDE